MLFDNNNIDLDFSLLNISNLKENNYYTQDNRNFYSAKEGFLRGNMFKDEYNPYKRLTYINIKPKSDRESKLYNVMCYAFAITDMNLYLDTHPDDRRALNYLKELIMEEEKAKKEYIAMYGPLDICDNKNDKFEWVNSPWPWDNFGGAMYV